MYGKCKNAETGEFVDCMCFDLEDSQELGTYIEDLEVYGQKLENLLDAVTEGE
jgi:hypothetical protein